MKNALVLFAVVCFSTLPAVAAEPASPQKVAQDFYDAYVKVLASNGDTQKFVLSSAEVTRGFKKAFRKLMKLGMESDPVICGQDFPGEGYAASPAQMRDGKAVVTMTSRSKDMPVSFPVTLRNVGGRWLISDTNELKADVDD